MGFLLAGFFYLVSAAVDTLRLVLLFCMGLLWALILRVYRALGGGASNPLFISPDDSGEKLVRPPLYLPWQSAMADLASASHDVPGERFVCHSYLLGKEGCSYLIWLKWNIETSKKNAPFFIQE